jgi:hypothetical protein
MVSQLVCLYEFFSRAPAAHGSLRIWCIFRAIIRMTRHDDAKYVDKIEASLSLRDLHGDGDRPN